MPSSRPVDPAPVIDDTTCLIGGVRREGNGDLAGSWNPSNGELVDSFAVADGGDVADAVSAASAAALHWRNVSLTTRGAVVAAWADAIERERDALVSLIQAEIGLTAAEARADLDEGVRWLRALDRSPPGEPLGHLGLVTTGISPIAVPVTRIGAGLIAGNTIVWRPPLAASVVSTAVASHAQDLPAGALNVVLGDTDVALALAEQRLAGLHVVSDAVQARRICGHGFSAGNRVYGELSGFSSVVVLATADLELAARELVRAAFRCAGQASAAVKRVIVEPPIYAELCAQLAVHAARLRVGDTADESVDMGPLSDARSAQAMADRVNEMLTAGCRAVIGSSRLGELGESFFAATVLAVPAGASMPDGARGPVVAVAPAEGADAIRRLAGAPVAAGILCDDVERAGLLAEQLDATTIRLGSPPSPHVHETLFGRRASTRPAGGRYPLVTLRRVSE